MTQPPKMSPLALQSAGMGMTLSTSSRSVGRAVSDGGLELLDMGTISGQRPPFSCMRPDNPARTSIALPASPGAAGHPPAQRSDWGTLKRLLPYLWQYKVRVVLALAFMVAAKTANVGVPLLLKELVDAMTIRPGSVESMLVVPLGLLLAYGLLRLSTSVFTELRELVFAKATEGATRSIALQVFGHLHALSLRFHLERQTGGMTRDIERGTRGVQSLISYSLYSIFPR